MNTWIIERLFCYLEINNFTYLAVSLLQDGAALQGIA